MRECLERLVFLGITVQSDLVPTNQNFIHAQAALRLGPMGIPILFRAKLGLVPMIIGLNLGTAISASLSH